MNDFINQPPEAFTFRSPPSIRRSCQNCDYIGTTLDIKCPRCGKIPLASLSKLKARGALIIARGVCAVAVLSVIPLTVSEFSPIERITFVSELFRGDALALALILWSVFLVVFAGACEIIAGSWLIFYAKPNRAVQTLRPMLYVLCVLTGLIFVILNKIHGYD